MKSAGSSSARWSRSYQLEAELRLLEKDRFRVCIFGSARIQPNDPTYRMVYDMARMLADLQIDIVTGGGPGLMEAANRACAGRANEQKPSLSGCRSTCLTPSSWRTSTWISRASTSASPAAWTSSCGCRHGVIVAPGGIGTLLELLFVWQLIQVRMIEARPVILLDRSMWGGLLEWMHERMLGPRIRLGARLSTASGAWTPRRRPWSM